MAENKKQKTVIHVHYVHHFHHAAAPQPHYIMQPPLHPGPQAQYIMQQTHPGPQAEFIMAPVSPGFFAAHYEPPKTGTEDDE